MPRAQPFPWASLPGSGDWLLLPHWLWGQHTPGAAGSDSSLAAPRCWGKGARPWAGNALNQAPYGSLLGDASEGSSALQGGTEVSQAQGVLLGTQTHCCPPAAQPRGSHPWPPLLPPVVKSSSCFSSLVLIFNLLSLADSWARERAGWLLLPSCARLGAEPIPQHSWCPPCREGETLRWSFCLGCSFTQVMLSRQGGLWSWQGWFSTTLLWPELAHTFVFL